MNSQGIQVLEQNFKAESTTVNHVINLERKPNGEYLVIVVSKDKKLSKKILEVE